MITQPHERNIFDQALLSHALTEAYPGICMIRLSCDDIMSATALDPNSSTLTYHSSTGPTEVSVVYYRCMYGPEDFGREEHWQGRERLERSRAINCPNLATQLAGCKKVQQVLTDAAFLKGRLPIPSDELRSTWMPIHALDDQGVCLVTDPAHAARFVLKPQREGGGHNIYKDAIPGYVANLSAEERKAYILMQLIETPSGVRNLLVRGGSSAPAAEVVSELGVLGVALFRSGPEEGQVKMLRNVEAGHLLRTKNSESDEGGVAVGISCLDSPYLI